MRLTKASLGGQRGAACSLASTLQEGSSENLISGERGGEAAFTLTIISCPVTDSAHLWGAVKELRFNKSPSICNTIAYSYKLVPADGT